MKFKDNNVKLKKNKLKPCPSTQVAPILKGLVLILLRFTKSNTSLTSRTERF